MWHEQRPTGWRLARGVIRDAGSIALSGVTVLSLIAWGGAEGLHRLGDKLNEWQEPGDNQATQACNINGITLQSPTNFALKIGSEEHAPGTTEKVHLGPMADDSTVASAGHIVLRLEGATDHFADTSNSVTPTFTVDAFPQGAHTYEVGMLHTVNERVHIGSWTINQALSHPTERCGAITLTIQQGTLRQVGIVER